ncbi:MAG: DUF5674 family protein [Patescibacteria group bacterium]
MLLILTKPATESQVAQMAEVFSGYIKLVVDVDRRVLAGGGRRHYEGEQKLLELGANQHDLWGGGLDLISGEVDYNSIINLRPSDNNPSREILSVETREKFAKIVKRLIPASLWTKKP